MIRSVLATVAVGVGLVACTPVPPPSPSPPPPVAMTVPMPPMPAPMVEPAYEPAPPVRHRRARATVVAVSRCPDGMYWRTSYRVLIAGTTKTKTVSGACVVKRKGKLS
jgi:hypothetical protein